MHNPSTGTAAPATWGDQVRDNLEFLIDPPVCSVFHSTSQLLPTTTGTVMLANSENFDNNSMHSTVTNTSRITCQTAGRYLLSALVGYAFHAPGHRAINLRVNGTVTIPGSVVVQATSIAGGSTGIVMTHTAVLGVGDYVEVIGFQASGGNLNVTLDEFTAVFLTR